MVRFPHYEQVTSRRLRAVSKCSYDVVVTLVMVNIDDLAPTAFTSAFNASGAVDRTYSPPNATLSLDEWPTLSELTNANTNLVVFMDTQADFSSVPYLIDEFSHMFEDAYGE